MGLCARGLTRISGFAHNTTILTEENQRVSRSDAADQTINGETAGYAGESQPGMPVDMLRYTVWNDERPGILLKTFPENTSEG